MSFFSKTVFFALFGVGGLLGIFYFFNAVNLIHSIISLGSGKKSEAIIFLCATLVEVVGLYFAFTNMTNSGQYGTAIGILIASIVLSILVVFIGLFFSNGPLHWQ